MKITKRTNHVMASFFIAGLIAASAAPLTAAEKVKLTGCLIQGFDGDGGYLLVNHPSSPATSAATPAVTPSSVGTTGAFANIFYWLEKEDILRPHVGHQIEVEGELGSSLREGEIKIDRKADWTEIEVKSNGKEMKAHVPNASIVAGPNPDRKLNVLVSRIDADKVRMLAATCR
jgi:hypothetical protein